MGVFHDTASEFNLRVQEIAALEDAKDAVEAKLKNFYRVLMSSFDELQSFDDEKENNSEENSNSGNIENVEEQVEKEVEQQAEEQVEDAELVAGRDSVVYQPEEE
ncbi:hypothetical protein HK100_004553 [Physocladia obscura]|uniref:Uncharacterized protein n=1 Tax=Physocladia obscura TaxID=109957 RepID=A0AAD5SSR9_9FUNG|nr:hypothetical protein HK100_004553 [Physocladia obscura]